MSLEWVEDDQAESSKIRTTFFMNLMVITKIKESIFEGNLDKAIKILSQ